MKHAGPEEAEARGAAETHRHRLTAQQRRAVETQRAGAARSRKGAKQPPVLIEVSQPTERRRQCRVSEIERQRTQRAALLDTSRHLNTEQSQEQTRQVTTTEETEAREAAETPTEIP